MCNSTYENAHVLLAMSTGLLLKETMVELELSPVGKFLLFLPSIDELKKWVSNQWKVEGNVKLNAISNSLFLFSFVNEEDLVYVLTSGPRPYVSNN